MTEKPLMPLMEYGKSRGWNRTQSYSAVENNVIPFVRVGRLIFIPVQKADRQLGLILDGSAAA